MLQALSNEDKLSRNGVTVEYAREMFGNDAAGRFALRSMMNLNQFYSENLGEDVLRGMNASAREGKVMSRPPFGYSILDGKFAPDSEEADAVREIYRLYNEGVKMAQICGHLKELGYRSKSGHEISLNSVRNVLVKDVYRGHYTWNGIEYHIPALIDDETWHKSRLQRDSRTFHPQKHKAKEVYYLSGKLFCSDCGSRMSGTSAQFKGKTYRWYICKNDKRKIQKDILEDCIVKNTQELLLEGSILDTIVAEIYNFNKSLDERDEVMDQLQKELKETNSAIANIVSAIEHGVTLPDLKERSSALQERRTEIERKIDNHKRATITLSKSDIEAVLKSYVKPMIENNYDDAKRLILEEFVHHAVLFDDHVVVYFNFLNHDKTPINKEYKIKKASHSTNTPDGSPTSTIVELEGILFVGFPFRIS